MILYRVQASVSREHWTTVWASTRAEAERRAGVIRELCDRVHVDRVEIGDSREALALAMEHAQANRSVWKTTEDLL